METHKAQETPIFFDFLQLQKAARDHLNGNLAYFFDFQQEVSRLIDDPSNTTTKTSIEAQTTLQTQLRLCAEVIQSLETQQQTLDHEQELHNHLDQILSEIQTHLNPDEPSRILDSLHEATNTALDAARNTIQSPEEKQDEQLLTNFEDQLRKELGGLIESVNIQQSVQKTRETLESEIKQHREELHEDIHRQIRYAQLATDQIFSTLRDTLSDDFRYYELIETARDYLEVTRNPETHIKRVTQFREALETWTEFYTAWVAFLEGDAIYQELLAQPTVADDFDPEDRHRLECLCGTKGTALHERLGVLEPTREAFRAACKAYCDAYERWLGDIHFLGADQRAIVEHGCKWIDMIMDKYYPQRHEPQTESKGTHQ